MNSTRTHLSSFPRHVTYRPTCALVTVLAREYARMLGRLRECSDKNRLATKMEMLASEWH